MLRAVSGATAVNTYNHNKPGHDLDLNKIGVFLKLDVDGKKKNIRVHFNEKNQSLLVCALEARQTVQDLVQDRYARSSAATG